MTTIGTQTDTLLTNGHANIHHEMEQTAEGNPVRIRTKPSIVLLVATLLAAGCVGFLIFVSYSADAGGGQIVGPVVAVVGLAMALGSISVAMQREATVDLRSGQSRPVECR